MQIFARLAGLCFTLGVLMLFVLPALMGRFGPAKTPDRPAEPASVQQDAAPSSAANRPASGGAVPLAVRVSPPAVRVSPPAVRVSPPVGSSSEAPPKVKPAYHRPESSRSAAIDKAHPARPEAPVTKRYFHVQVKDGGTLLAGKHIIRLGDISVRGADAKCTNARGKNWPCGLRARAELARFIRGRAVTCVLPPGGERDDFSARCHIGNDDLSMWMVRQGWAKSAGAAETGLNTAEKAARTDKLGLWAAAN